jgi:deoxyribonuclease IV
MTKIGLHVSAAGDVALAPQRALDDGCECFQFFSRPPQGGPAKEITSEQAEKFKIICKDNNLSSYIHTPYYINLASATGRIYHGSVSVIREELERGSQLGVDALMTHIGSAKDLGGEKAIKKVIKGIAEILDGYTGSTRFLIENAAGAGAIIGDSFEEIAGIINAKELKKYSIGVCLDTCHAFASGYDLRDEKTVKETFKKFDEVIGLDKLVLIHGNDSKTELDSKKDRHEHIGDGEIGKAGFEALVKLADQYNVDIVLETPKDGKELEDLKLLKKMRK